MEKKIVIIGAGATGLGAGYRLNQLGQGNFTIYERESHVGGAGATLCDNSGFTWDLTAPLTRPWRYEYYDVCFAAMVKDQIAASSEQWVRVGDTWVPQNFVFNLRCLPPEVRLRCVIDLCRVQASGDNYLKARNYGEFLDAVYGAGISNLYTRPYAFKSWACPADILPKEWVSESGAFIDMDRVLRGIVMEESDLAWGSNTKFKYPLKGGGELYRKIGEHLEHSVVRNAEVVAINSKQKEVHLASGSVVPYDQLITTMPLDQLCLRVLNDMPDDLRIWAKSLRHTRSCVVGIGVHKPCPPDMKLSMLFPGDEYLFHRVTCLSGYSPRMTPDPTEYYSLLCEISHSEYKPEDLDTVHQDTIRGLIKAGLLSEEDRGSIVSTWVHSVEYARAMPLASRHELLDLLLPWLEERDIYSRGAFGAWIYEEGDADQCFMQGVEIVNRLLLGEPEKIGAYIPRGKTTV